MMLNVVMPSVAFVIVSMSVIRLSFVIQNVTADLILFLLTVSNLGFFRVI